MVEEPAEIPLVAAVTGMDDESFIKHLEYRHPELLAEGFEFRPLPGRDVRRMESRGPYEAAHDREHRLGSAHVHE